MENSIREYLYTKGLYDDVINLIHDYSKLTLKEQCLDKKSLKRFAKHQKWLEKQNYNKSIDDKIYEVKKELYECKNKIIYYREFIFVKDLTQPPQDNGRYTTIFPRMNLYRHPLSKEEVYNVDLIIANLDNCLWTIMRKIMSMMNFNKYNFYGKLEKINFLLQ